ncbi:hypothetical protein MTO96_030217 [Rhipicephalus appendiculatus]
MQRTRSFQSLQKTVEDYNRGGAAFRELTPGTVWNTNRQKLDILYSEVNSKDFPTISDYAILSFLNPYGDIFEKGLGFGSNVCIVAFILQAVVTASFLIGTWAHDPEIPPNKRGFISNQSGITLVVYFHLPMMVYTRPGRPSSCGCSRPVMVPSSILYMMSGVIASKYICDPYQNDGTWGLEILDNVTASLYVKGKWDPTENSDYELYNTTYRPGHVIRKCNDTTPLVNLSTNPDVTIASMTFKTHGYPMYLRLLEENKALTLPSSVTLPSGLAVKLSDAKNALDALSPRTASTAVTGSIKSTDDAKNVSARWKEGFTALASDDAYRQSLQASMNKEYLEYIKTAIHSQLSKLERTTKAVFTTLGDCKPIREFYIQCLDAFCNGTLLCMNGIWFSVWLVCGMFTTQIAVGLKLSKYLMRMDDYMYEGIEVEESV